MCGICGVLGRADPAVLRRMTATLTHRGPDDAGFHEADGIALGVRRLSIIDVAGGHQPITNEDGTIVVVFNGEIYNHPQLRKRLEGQGHRFRTRADTEVLVHLYEEYGDACVHPLQGMFAFALWDAPRRRLLLARDRLGIKPLYYRLTTDEGIVFASEAKALFQHPDIRAAIDPEALDLYLALRYVPSPDTLFRGIEKLPPGHILICEDERATVRRYWEPVLGDFLPTTRLDEAVEEFAALFQETVRLHLVSDVPVGMLLSGGIDSSAVAAMMARARSTAISTFTVGFDIPGVHNELDAARAVATHIGAEHHELVVSPDAARLLPMLLRHLDEPVADPALLPTYLICRFARESVPVVLTGEGGDELLAGYPRYVWFARARRLQRVLPRWVRERVLLPVSRLAPVGERYHRALDNFLAERTDLERHLHWVAGLAPELKPALAPLRPLPSPRSLGGYLNEGDGDVIHRLMALDMRTWLVDDVLTKMDKMSMAASVEARVPFLDHRLVEFVAGVPLAVKMAEGPKTLLRRAMAGVLPPRTIRRRKQAFQIPLDQWLAGPLAGFVRDVLLDRPARERGWIDTRRLESMIPAASAAAQRSRGSQRRRLDGQSLWTLLCLELWAREFLD